MKPNLTFFLVALVGLAATAQAQRNVLPPFQGDAPQHFIDRQELQLDKNHLLLDGALTDAQVAGQPFVFNSFQKAVSSFQDTTTLYIAPYVYWVDDPDHPEVVTGIDGREPLGMVIRTKSLHFIGLSDAPEQVVLASQRGQMQGAVGNFTMFDFHVQTLKVENLTMGNYCNVDLDYAPNPSLSRPKRSAAITQAHVGYVHGDSLLARNVRFISRLNLNPLNGARHSTYIDCHFECTDDALNGNAIYRHCDFDLYGQKPFWSTSGSGPMLIDCDFYVKTQNREMVFCKQGGPMTLIDCRYHAPEGTYLGWTNYPQKWLRCYQRNFTMNGRPYVIGQRQPENTVLLEQVPNDIPFLRISRHEAKLQSPAQLRLASAPEAKWKVDKEGAPFVTSIDDKGDSIVVNLKNNTDETVHFCIVATTDDGREAACQVSLTPELLAAPELLKSPVIKIADGMAHFEYALNLQGRRDESIVSWSRVYDDGHTVLLSTTNDKPASHYRLRPSDVGHKLMVSIRPKHQRSLPGEAHSFMSERITADEMGNNYAIDTDFSDLNCAWSTSPAPDCWQVDGYKPLDTKEYDWSFNREKPMWTYGEGFNGAVGKGLLQAQRGARLMYIPAERTYDHMSLRLNVDPTKTAGQGFGSATGQYMDVCIKFDPQTLTGYGLRIIRTAKHAKAVDFLLVAYEQGVVRPLTSPVTSTCYRTGCLISVDFIDGLLSAAVTTTTPKPSDSTLPHNVSLQAHVSPNTFGGLMIQHTGTCGESTTMLHRLNVAW